MRNKVWFPAVIENMHLLVQEPLAFPECTQTKSSEYLKSNAVIGKTGNK
jgi:hypothetical protein